VEIFVDLPLPFQKFHNDVFFVLFFVFRNSYNLDGLFQSTLVEDIEDSDNSIRKLCNFYFYDTSPPSFPDEEGGFIFSPNHHFYYSLEILFPTYDVHLYLYILYYSCFFFLLQDYADELRSLYPRSLYVGDYVGLYTPINRDCYQPENFFFFFFN
jgi:hypothetical protein